MVQVLFAMNMTVAYPCKREEIGEAQVLLLSPVSQCSAVENTYLGVMKSDAPTSDRDLGSLLVSSYWIMMLRH